MVNGEKSINPLHLPADRGARHGQQQRNRSSASLSDLRTTPIVDNFLSMLPTGHEKALKYAFYNVIAVIIAAGIILAMWGVYCILEPFIKALMWATLCGSVLHPFKEQLCGVVRGWLKSSKESSIPFTLLVAVSPLKVADSVSDKIGSNVQKHWKSIGIGMLGFILTYILYYNPPLRLVSILHWVGYSLWILSTWLLSRINATFVIGINAAYFLGLVSLIVSRKRRRESRVAETVGDNTDVAKSSPIVQDPSLDTSNSIVWALILRPHVPWIVTAIYVCMQLPYPLLLLLATCIALGANVYLRRQRKKSFKYTLPRISKLACMMVLNIGSEGGAQTTGNTSSPFNLNQRRATTLLSPSVATAIEKDQGDRIPLHRSYSDGSASVLRPISVGESNDSPARTPFSSPQDDETPYPETDIGEDEVDSHGIDSNKFLYGVSMACLIVFVWQRLWLMHLLPIPVVYYGLKNLGAKFRIKEYAIEKVSEYKDAVNEAAGEYLAPKFAKVMLEILHEGDKKLIAICENCVDSVVSLIIVVLVVMATVSGLIFAATQVYAEGDHLIRVTGNLINKTVSEHPEVNQLLPEGWQTMLSSMVGNAFIYGREYITSAIRSSATAEGTIQDQQNAHQMEKQLIELWDKLYVAWNRTYENAFSNVTKSQELSTQQTVSFSWDDLFLIGKNTTLELSVLTDYARANLGTLWSILDSLWNVLIGNVSLAFSSITSIISLLVGGGSAIVNLIINLIIFFTALFYLLSSSGLVYKPVELFNQFSTGAGESTSNFAVAVEESVNGVFVASFKMATFYGMWTWLTHNLFQVNIVFVPSIFGGMFAAVPFLMPYWAAIPAVLELWLIQGLWWKALLMFGAQVLPMSAVDTQIYSEIKGGGHPYLTGLAVAGGIFYFGVQGAIVGPVILCLVIVAVKVGRSFMWEEADKELA